MPVTLLGDSVSRLVPDFIRIRTMLVRLLPLLLLTACARADVPVFEQIATLEQDSLVEASGLARSQRDSTVFWALNDGGSKARLWALDAEGRHLGRITIEGVKNRDWEDLASFTLDDTPYLLVADIGNNEAKHKSLKLHIVEEPDLSLDNKVKLEPAWSMSAQYPEGPRDAESVAVDIANQQILVLTKRDLPPQLYSVPLKPDKDKLMATRLGSVKTLPWPTKRDVEYAPIRKEWHWQPTAMDISADGTLAAIMTYRWALVYERSPGESWMDTLAKKPTAVSLNGFKDAEAMMFDADNEHMYATVEKRFAPLLRASIPGEQQP